MWNIAIENEEIVINLTLETEASSLAQAAARIATEAANVATQEKNIATEAKDEALSAKDIAVSQSGVATAAKDEAVSAKNIAVEKAAEAIETAADMRAREGGIIIDDALFNGNKASLINFRESFIDFNIDGTLSENDYLYIYSLVIDPLVNNRIQIYIGKDSSRTNNGNISNIICAVTINSILSKTEIEKHTIPQYSGSGFTSTVTIDFKKLNKTVYVEVTSTSLKNYDKMGIRPLFFKKLMPLSNNELKPFFKKVGDNIYFLSKFDSSRDLQVRFSKAMFNQLMTFQRVGLINNSNPYVNRINIDVTPSVILNNVGSDNIGPIGVASRGWIGGNHSHNNDGITKTANNISYELYVDGHMVNSDISGYFNEALIVVKNILFDPSLLPSTQTGLIEETVSYRIIGSSIDVTVSLRFLSNVNVLVYYGFQSIFNSAFSKIYYGHSQHLLPTNHTAGGSSSSGSLTEYPNVEKIVLSNSDKSVCQSMSLNRSIGLGLGIPENISGSESIAFVSSGKSYFRLISNKVISAGARLSWNGCYSWFNQSSYPISEPTIHSYPHLRAGEKVFSIDMSDAGIHFAKYKNGKMIAVEENTDSFMISSFSSSEGTMVESVTSGGCIIK